MSLIIRILLLFVTGLFILSCNKDIGVNKEIIGNLETVVLKKYNKPQRELIIKLTKNTSLYEYQSNLYSLHPNIKATDTVLLKEMFWNFKGGDKMVIWLEKVKGEWIVIDNIRWSKDIKF